jgi:hypothetical protein
MNLDEQQRMTWPAHTGFVLNSASQSGAVYQATNGFSLAPGHYYHYTQDGMPYETNYKLTYPAQHSTSNCPRSYAALDLSGMPHDLAVADSFPPNAYHIEPPKHQDAMDLADHEIKNQLMQLRNDYDHPQCTYPIKAPDHNRYQSPYSDPTQGATTHDDSFRHPQDFDAEETGAFDREQPYAQLIYQALLNAPNHTMILRDIYDWFKNNTDKATGSETKGWQNSIRHNLSMNGVCCLFAVLPNTS